MGSYDFMNTGHGTDANDAFLSLVDQAQYEHGHGGYTGTIAEKHSFVMLPKPPLPDDLRLEDACQLALGHQETDWQGNAVEQVYGGETVSEKDENGASRWVRKNAKPIPPDLLVWLRYASEAVDDKWGPAGCVELDGPDKDGTRRFLFFGYASS